MILLIGNKQAISRRLALRDCFRTNDLVYPEYYLRQNFHGILEGYLNEIAPITYNAVTQFATLLYMLVMAEYKGKYPDYLLLQF